jgi:hypothetical protein
MLTASGIRERSNRSAALFVLSVSSVIAVPRFAPRAKVLSSTSAPDWRLKVRQTDVGGAGGGGGSITLMAWATSAVA